MNLRFASITSIACIAGIASIASTAGIASIASIVSIVSIASIASIACIASIASIVSIASKKSLSFRHLDPLIGPQVYLGPIKITKKSNLLGMLTRTWTQEKPRDPVIPKLHLRSAHFLSRGKRNYISRFMFLHFYNF